MDAIDPVPLQSVQRGLSSAWTKIAVMALTPLVILMAVVYYRYDPSKNAHFIRCLFYKLTNLYCPGCGSQRAAHELLHGQPLLALHDNALMCLSIPLLLWELFSSATHRGMRLLHRRYSGWIVFGAVMLFWVARNIPIWPCTLLSPL